MSFPTEKILKKCHVNVETIVEVVILCILTGSVSKKLKIFFHIVINMINYYKVTAYTIVFIVTRIFIVI